MLLEGIKIPVIIYGIYGMPPQGKDKYFEKNAFYGTL